MSVIPVAALAATILITVLKSLPALQQLGLVRLLAPTFGSVAGRPTYGLLAPLWGTVLLTIEALLIGLPIAFCVAVIAREFRVPLLSRSLNALVGLLGGIPPVIYAVMAVVFMEGFMRPKLGGFELGDQRVAGFLQGLSRYNQFVLPVQLPNSTLLTGLLLGLLTVPFMAPVIDDAFRVVPVELKNGSYALGADRWQTLWRIVVPHALPGILAAAGVGALIALGEVIIPTIVAGGVENGGKMPSPLWNVLARTPSLTSTAASLEGALALGERPENIGLQQAVSYTSGLLLLVFAMVLMALETVARRRLRRAV